jgi:hypothetical protein
MNYTTEYCGDCKHYKSGWCYKKDEERYDDDNACWEFDIKDINLV